MLHRSQRSILEDKVSGRSYLKVTVSRKFRSWNPERSRFAFAACGRTYNLSADGYASPSLAPGMLISVSKKLPILLAISLLSIGW